MMMNQKIPNANGSLVTLPMFANVYKMEGVQEANKKNDWWGWKITLDKSVNDLKSPAQIVEEAKHFHELVSSGSVDPAPEALNDNDEGDMKDITPNADSNVLGS